VTDRVCGCSHLQTQHHGPCAECRCPMWHPDHEIVPALINEKWGLNLPDYRAYRPTWAWHEAARLAAMHSVIIPGDVVYEIGAEEGDHAALFCQWGARVFLAEPNPHCWPSIRASMQANGYEPAAYWVGLVGDHEWSVYDDDMIDRFGTRGQWPDCANGDLIAEHGFQHIAEHSAVTPGASMSHLVARSGLAPNVVSVDVEGAEMHVLRGFREVFRRNRPVVFVSIHPEFMDNLYGLAPDDVHDLMADNGYQGLRLAYDHEDHWVYWHPEGRRPW
jgi:FkbM family methyltransferase